jgi:organic radical activating enzyme
LSHCNLRCYFCDTQFDAGSTQRFCDLIDNIATMSRTTGCTLLVITGGEPLLQDIVPIVRAVNELGIRVSVETAGTTYRDNLPEVFSPVRSIAGNLIVCSPKTPKVNKDLEPLIGAWKYIIKAGHVGAGGIPNQSTQRQGESANIYLPDNPSIPIFVQAMDEYDAERNQENLRAAAKIALRFGYRLSVQMHKLAELP